jgi:CRISPR-associated endonuclease/helicase Cas3
MMTAGFFAHSVDGRPESEWETLLRHLRETDAGARRRGDKFGAADLAGLAGRLHDLGKYKRAFQDRLCGGPSTDHASAGANYARAHLGFPGRVLAHAIAGHHTGLKDGLLADEGRLDRTAPELAAIIAAARADGLELPDAVAQPEGFTLDKTMRGFQFAFLTRMLFSCLIDADRTAAAAFDAAARGETSEPPPPASLARLETALAGFLAARAAGPTADRPINRLREDVLRHAQTRADAPRGVFTLTVPTGGGKTLTSLAFALAHARRHGLDRVIVVIPFTSVIEQTARVFREALGALGDQVLEHHSAFDATRELRDERIGPERLRLSMATWDFPIVVTTAVQFFESLFSNRPSRCRKLHSIARSVIVLDEAQTMPLKLLRPCVAALKELVRNYRSSVVLCTATQPALTAPLTGREDGFRGGFETPEELAPDVPRLFAALRRTTVRRIGEQDDAALAERMAGHEQALCIVNQRAHARALFGAIRHLPGARHLSTVMHAVHRARVLGEIRADLKAGRPCRVVSTSLIEAGVDVSFPLVLRAEAGLDQIAQAAGRCNREGEASAEASEVLVFRAPDYKVLQELRANAEAGLEVLGLHAADPFAPPAIRAFFEMLYWRKGSSLDAHGVLEACATKAATLDFPFETIARDMRFIDDTMVPVIVPKEDGGAAAALLDRLRHVPTPGALVRDLQRYTVGIPRTARAGLVAAGLAEVIREGDFGDQFVVLHHLDLYRPETGLDWTDPTFAETERLIVA